MEYTLEEIPLAIGMIFSELREVKKELELLKSQKEPSTRLLSTKEIAAELGVSQWKIREMTAEKTIPHKRAGAKYLYSLNEVLKSINVSKRR
ncbi:helix-turn-helix domain-containing protein [Sphingobacterium sp.]|uniref:helix-turn-helix domain-containing protein n=1 Tax=Sphingobacterium sp. TaxID=341027 RepID=UPI0031D8FB5C